MRKVDRTTPLTGYDSWPVQHYMQADQTRKEATRRLIDRFLQPYLQFLDHSNKICGQLKNLPPTFPWLLKSLKCSFFISNIDRSFSTGFLQTKNEINSWSSCFNCSMILCFSLDSKILCSISFSSSLYISRVGFGGFLTWSHSMKVLWKFNNGILSFYILCLISFSGDWFYIQRSRKNLQLLYVHSFNHHTRRNR